MMQNKIIGWLILIYALMISAVYVIRAALSVWFTSIMIEMLLAAIMVHLLLLNKDFRGFFLRLPKVHAAYIFVFFILMSLGQYLSFPDATFPFVRWHMYGERASHERAVYYEYVGIDEDGNTITIKPSVLFPTLGRSRLAINLDRRSKQLAMGKELPQAQIFQVDSPEEEVSTRNSQIKKAMRPFLKKIFISERDKSELSNQEVVDKVLEALIKQYNLKNKGKAGKLIAMEIIQHSRSYKSIEAVKRKVIYDFKLKEGV